MITRKKRRYGLDKDGNQIDLPPEYKRSYRIAEEGERIDQWEVLPYFSTDANRWFGFPGDGYLPYRCYRESTAGENNIASAIAIPRQYLEETSHERN